MALRRACAALAALVLAAGFAIGLIVRARAGMPVAVKLMDPHMEITLRRLPEAGDRERADAIVAAAKSLVARYPNYRNAERDGYEKFLPNLVLPQEHFTNDRFLHEALDGTFNPDHPTSLVYNRTATGLQLAGVMYMAPSWFTEADLDREVPLSIGVWHRHVSLCWAPDAYPYRKAYFGEHPPFGFFGTIATRDECVAARGQFWPIFLGWMIHVWPNATGDEAVWSVHGVDERHDMVGEHEHHHHAVTAGTAVAGSAAVGALPIPLDHLPAAEVSSGDAMHGAAVFAQNCASCHGAGGRSGGDADAPVLAAQGLEPGQVAFMVRNPRAIDVSSDMPALAISDGDLADVAAYVSALK